MKLKQTLCINLRNKIYHDIQKLLNIRRRKDNDKATTPRRFCSITKENDGS